MVSWEEWENLVKDCKNGDGHAFEVLLRSSQEIVKRVVKGMTQTKSGPQDFVVDSDDVFQEVTIKIHKKLGTIKNPRSYVRWLKQVAKNVWLDKSDLIRKEIRLESGNKLEGDEAEEINLNRIEEKRTVESNSFVAFQEFQHGFLERDYQSKALLQVSNLTAENIEREYFAEVKDPRQLNWLMTILGKALIDKREYQYPEAESKLKAIIQITDKKRLNTEIRFIRAKAFFELGHLKMNEGYVEGPEGSIFYYDVASRLWKSLRDKPNFIYTIQQIGVSYYIQNDLPIGREIYESILKELPRSKVFREIKSNILRDLSNAYLALRDLRDADKNIEKSLDIAKDIGETCLFFSKLQKAKILVARRKYDEAYSLAIESIKDRPASRYHDRVKANILLFELYMATNQKRAASALMPYIQEKCKSHLFYHQLQKFNNLRIRYHMV